jgi:hypothetical protein
LAASALGASTSAVREATGAGKPTADEDARGRVLGCARRSVSRLTRPGRPAGPADDLT